MELRTLVVACLLGAALAGPISRDDSKCSQKCTSPSSKKIHFPEGKTYVYHYQSDTTIGQQSQNDPLGQYKMSAEVHVGSLEGCDMVIQLIDVRFHSDQSRSFAVTKQQLERNLLVFSYDDGEIQEICPSAEDQEGGMSEQAQNIRRGILSLLINNAESLEEKSTVQETTILGTCQAVYEPSQGWGSLVIKKTKDLRSCQQGQQNSVQHLATPYLSPDSPVQSARITNGQLTCEHTIDKNQLLQSVRCKQVEKLQPFSEESSGVEIVTESRLRYVSERDGVEEDAEAGEPTTLLFAAAPRDQEDGDVSDARNVLEKLCQSTQDGVQPRTPYHLSMLVKALKPLPEQQIRSLYEDLQSDRPCPGDFIKDLFLDALAMAETKGALKVLAKLIQEDQLSDIRVQTFFTLLAFYTHVDEPFIQAFIPFLKDPSKAGRQSLFGISSMIGNFCNQKQFHNSPKDCRDVPAVQHAIEALKQHLGRNGQVDTPEEEERQIESLIALKNVGRLGNAREVAAKIFQQKDNSPAARVAALKAHVHAPKDPQSFAKIMKVFKDISDDPEVRIHAFLVAMTKITSDNVQEIEITLKKEKDDSQVGAFVWSHLKNIKESSTPLYEELRHVLRDITLSKRFANKSILKYSQNRQLGFFSNRLNMGVDAELSVIHKARGVLPSAGQFNLTTYLFGESYNPLALHVRADGLEQYVQRKFGPKGISWNGIRQMLGFQSSDQDYDENQSDEDNEEDSYRSSRRNKKQNKYSFLRERQSSPRRQETPNAAVDVTIMGKTIARATLEDFKSLLSLHEAFSLMEFMEQMSKQQEVERSYSAKILDGEVTVPTISGLKVQIAVNATLVAGIKAQGKFDIRDIVAEERRPNIDIEGKLAPSAAVEVVAVIGLQTGDNTPGIKAVFQSHTAQYIQGKIQIKDGRLATIKIDTPKQEIPLATVRLELYKLKQSGEEVPIRSINARSIDDCTESLSRPFGIELCLKAKAPKPLLDMSNPIVPLAGGASLQISLKKTDQSMQGFVATIEVPQPQGKQQSIRVEFDTPGSRVDRKFALQAQIESSPEKHSLSAKLVSPFKQLEADLSVRDSRQQKSAKASLVIDHSQRYSVEAQLQISGKGNQQEYKPSVTISLHRRQPFTIQGTISRSGKGQKEQIQIELQANRPVNKPSYIRGTIAKDGEFSLHHPERPLRISADLTASTPLGEVRLHHMVDKTKASVAIDTTVQYTLPRSQQQTAKLSVKVQNLGTVSFQKVSTVVDFQSSQFPRKSAHLVWQHTRKGWDLLENEITLKWGQSSPEPQYRLHQISKIQVVPNGFRKGVVDNSLEINTPYQRHPARLSLKTRWDMTQRDSPSVSVHTTYVHGQKQLLSGSVEYSAHLKSPMSLEFQATLNTPHREMKYHDSIREKSRGEFDGHCTVQWQKGESATFDYNYRIKSDQQKTHHEVQLKMMTPSMKIPMTHRGLLRVTRDTLEAKSHTQSEGKPVYSVELKLDPQSQSKLDVEYQGYDVKIRAQNEEDSYKLNYRIQEDGQDEEWSGSLEYEDPSNSRDKQLQLAASWGKPQDTTKQILATAKLSRTDDSSPPNYQLKSSLQIGQNEIEVETEGEVSEDWVSGPHGLKIKIDGKKVPKKIEVVLNHVIADDNTVNLAFSYSQDDEEKLRVETVAKYQKDSSSTEASWALSAKSPIRYLNGKELSFHYRREASPLSKVIFNLRGQVTPGKPYGLNIQSAQTGRNKNKFHVILTTPIVNHKSQDFTIAYQKSKKQLKIDVDATAADGSKVQGVLTLQQEGPKTTANLEFRSPYEQLRHLSIDLEYEGRSGYNQIQSKVRVNDNQKLGYTARFANDNHLDALLDIQTDIENQYNLKMVAFSDNHRSNFESSLLRANDEIMASKLSWQKQSKGQYNGQLEFKKDDFNWIVEASSERQGRDSQQFSVSSSGLGSPVAATLKLKQDKQEIASELQVCSPPGSNKCFKIDASYKNQDRRGQTKRSVEMQVVHQPHLDIKIEAELDSSQDYFKHNAELSIVKRVYQYEATYDNRKDNEAEVAVHVVTPARKASAEAHYKREDNTVRVNAVVVPDATRQPSKKLVVVYTQKDGRDQTHYSVVINHPEMDSPKRASLDVQTREGSTRPFDAKLTVELSPKAEDQYVGHIAIEDPTQKKQNLTVILEISDQAKQNWDFRLKAHLAKVGERMTVGAQWNAPQGKRKLPGSLFIELDTVEQEYHAYYRGPKNNAEAHGSWQTQPGKLFVFEENTNINGDENSLKMSVDIKTSCAEISFFDEAPSQTPSARLHGCMDIESNDLMSLTAESYQNGEKTTDANVAIRRQSGDKILSLHLHWSPEKAGELAYQLMEWSEQNAVDSSDVTETLQSVAKNAIELYDAVQENVVEPAARYTALQSSQFAQELQQDAKHIKKTMRKYYASLPDIQEPLDKMTGAISEVYDQIVDLVEEYTPKPVRRALEDAAEYFSDVAGSFCEYGSYCYQLQYAYNRHGLEGVGELVYSAFANMPEAYYKLVVAVKNAAQLEINLPEISFQPLEDFWKYATETWEELKDGVSELLETITSSDWYTNLAERLQKQYQEIREQFDRLYEKVEDYVKDIIEKIIRHPQLAAISAIIDEIWEEVKKALKDAKIGKVTDNVSEFIDELVDTDPLRDSVQVVTMDPEGGNIEVKVRYPEPQRIHSALKAINSYANPKNVSESGEEDDDDQDEESSWLEPVKSAVSKGIPQFLSYCLRKIRVA